MSDQDTFLSGIEILDTSPATSTSASLFTFGGISILSTTNASASSASFLTLGGTFIQGNTIIGGNTQLLSTTQSTNTTTGALTITGGIGIQGNAYGNFANFSNIQAIVGATLPNLVTTNASIGTLSLSTFNPANITTNNLVVTIGTSIANAVFTNITTNNLALANNFSAQRVNVTGTTGSFSTSTGTIIISGGIGVNQHIFANRGFYGDTVNLTNNSRPLNLVDTQAAISCWRWVPPTGANSGNPAIEFIGGTGGSATAVGNNYGDIYMDDSASIAFRNRTTGGSLVTFWAGQTGNIGIGTTTPNFKLETIGDARISGNVTAGTSLFTPNATINNLFSSNITSGNGIFASTTISTSTSTGALIVNGGTGIGGNLNVAGYTVINGSLTVNGTLTSVNSTNVNISDNLLVLNAGPSGTSDSGILIQRYQIDNNLGNGDVVSDTPIITGILQTGTNISSIVLPNSASSVNSFYNNYWVKITSGTANNNVRRITEYVGSTRTANISSNFSSVPTSNTDTFALYGNSYVTNYFKESVNEYTFGFTNITTNSTITDTEYANLRIGNLTNTLISSTNLIVTNATISNFTLPNFTLPINATFSNLLITNSTITSLINTNLTNTNSTLANLLATNNTLTNLISNFNTLPNLLSTSSTISTLLNTNLIGTNQTVTNLVSNFNTLTNLLSTSSTISTLLNTNLIGINQSVTNIVATNFTAGSLTTTNLNLTNFTTLNSRITSETIGSILATNINTTNFTVSSLNVTSLTSANAFFTNLTTTNLISTTNANMAGITLQYYTGTPAGSWINIPIGAGSASGIGHGGPGANPWIAYAGSPGYWFSNSSVGDICYQNLTGNLHFGNSTGLSTMQINNNKVTINSTIEALNSTTGSLIVNGGLVVNKNIDINSTTIATNTSTGALIVSGGAGFNGDIYANNLYSNGVLVGGGGGGGNVFGTEYNYIESLATSGTTNTNFQQKVSMTTSSLLGGTYKINVGYTFDVPSVSNQDGVFNVLLDPTNLTTGTLIHEHIQRKDRSSYVIPHYNSISRVLTPGIHFVSLIWSGSAIFMSNARLELFRVQ